MSDGNLENVGRAQLVYFPVHQGESKSELKIPKRTGVLLSSFSLKIKCSSAFGDSFSTSSHSRTSPFSRTSTFHPDISFITGKQRTTKGNSYINHRTWLSQDYARVPLSESVYMVLASAWFNLHGFLISWLRFSNLSRSEMQRIRNHLD